MIGRGDITGCQQQNSNCCFTLRENEVSIFKAKSKMTSIKARLNLTRLGKDDRYPLVIQIIHHRRKRELYTPYRLEYAEFDSRSEKALVHNLNKKRTSEIHQINDYLLRTKEEFEKLDTYLTERGDYTSADLVYAYRMHNDLSFFFIYADYKIIEMRSARKYGTAANYRSAVNAFERYIGNRTITTDSITQKNIEEFISFQELCDNNSNTISFYVKQLRAIYNKADDEGYVHSSADPFRKIRLKTTKTPKRAISKKDISRISGLNLQGKNEHLELACSLFMFSFYTRGMAFVDMCYLKKENIKGNMLVYKRRKTGQILQIKIEQPLKALLRKYANDDSIYLLPMLREDDSYKGYRYIQRRLNKRIRQIGVMLGFDFPLTFYVARHSWATLAHEKGVPVSVISEGMGHTSEKTTHIYLASLNHYVIDRANRTVMNSLK